MALTTVTPVRLTQNQQSQLTLTPVSLYTCPKGSFTKIQACTCSNITTGPVNVTVYLTSSGSGVTSAARIISNQPVQANSSYNGVELLNHILHEGDQVWAQASAGNSINIIISGTLIS
jgi:hypothetical protein